MTSKKNWTMRAAVLMLALVLITSCFVGGTFAKYVTSGSGSDTARVAKFGVQISATDGGMFQTAYNADDATTAGAITQTVKSSDSDKLVAPGTSGDNTSTFSIMGKPEVAVNVKLELAVNEEVFLKAGGYKDYTSSPYTGNFNLANNYYPVVFSLKQGGTEVASGNLNDIKTYLAGVSKAYEANTDLSTKFGTYTLSWKWDFDNSGAGTNDKADTLLGNLAADADTYKENGKWENNAFTDINAGDFSTNIDFTLKLSVTQID